MKIIEMIEDGELKRVKLVDSEGKFQSWLPIKKYKDVAKFNNITIEKEEKLNSLDIRNFT